MRTIKFISRVLKGNFSSFDAVPDEHIRAPQEPPGVITKAVAARIEEALKENCISIAVRTVEGDGIMAVEDEDRGVDAQSSRASIHNLKSSALSMNMIT